MDENYELRFIVNGKAGGWKSVAKITPALLNYFAEAYTEQFGNNWNIEYRRKEESTSARI